MERRPLYVTPKHPGCIFCAYIVRQRAVAHLRTLAGISLVAASLPALASSSRDSVRRKQETPPVSASEVSTDPTPVRADGTAAGVHGDTGVRR
jgi:hypothetical protein